MPPCAIAILMTCHNRKATTLDCLEALHAQAGLEGRAGFRVFLLDDGSTDGTGEAVSARFPEVMVLQGDGTCYWAGGMRRAWEAATAWDADAYLWLNDDTHLDPDALDRFCRLHQEMGLASRGGILVGTTRDPLSGAPTYGGSRQTSRMRPFQLSLIVPGSVLIRCDTFNGNCVWIPRYVVEGLGKIDDIFIHGMADTDYGFRAKRRGIPSWVIPGTIGTCAQNPGGLPWEADGISFVTRWRKILSPKGLPPGGWMRISLRYGGCLGPLYAIWPYLKLLRFILSRLISSGRRCNAPSDI